VGQDGISYAPTQSKTQLQAIREQIAGWNGNPTDEECATNLKEVGMFEWETIKGYLDCLDRNRTATNVAMLCPQVSLRLNVDRPRLTFPGQFKALGLWAVRFGGYSGGDRRASKIAPSSHVRRCRRHVQVSFRLLSLPDF